jgi:hypothetical protein
MYTIRPLTHCLRFSACAPRTLVDTSTETPAPTTLKILPGLHRPKLNVINWGLLFQGPVLFTERFWSTTLTITATKDEQSVVLKFQRLGEVLKWLERKWRLLGRPRDTAEVSGMLGKRRVGPIYKIINMFIYKKKWLDLFGQTFNFGTDFWRYSWHACMPLTLRTFQSKHDLLNFFSLTRQTPCSRLNKTHFSCNPGDLVQSIIFK